jgi:hypothetical protein
MRRLLHGGELDDREWLGMHGRAKDERKQYDSEFECFVRELHAGPHFEDRPKYDACSGFAPWLSSIEESARCT